jgi:hypothetical protein
MTNDTPEGLSANAVLLKILTFVSFKEKVTVYLFLSKTGEFTFCLQTQSKVLTKSTVFSLKQSFLLAFSAKGWRLLEVE